MRYMLMFFADEGAWTALPEEERAAAIGRIGAWYGQQAQAGRIVEGRRLSGKSTAITIRPGPAGRGQKPVVVDGPFLETKEAIGSYAIIDVADRDAAIAVAASWPAGGTVEIRPSMEG